MDELRVTLLTNTRPYHGHFMYTYYTEILIARNFEAHLNAHQSDLDYFSNPFSATHCDINPGRHTHASCIIFKRFGEKKTIRT